MDYNFPYNDTDFMIRNAMERWNNGINDFANNTGVANAADYQTDLFVEQLDRDEYSIKKLYLSKVHIQEILLLLI